MKHYVVQEMRRWDFEAKSFRQAKVVFRELRKHDPGDVEECTIVEQETGREKALRAGADGKTE